MKFNRYCLPFSVEIHRVRQYLVNVLLFGIKDRLTSEITANFEGNLYIKPVKKIQIFTLCIMYYFCSRHFKFNCNYYIHIMTFNVVGPEYSGWPFADSISNAFPTDTTFIGPAEQVTMDYLNGSRSNLLMHIHIDIPSLHELCLKAGPCFNI